MGNLFLDVYKRQGQDVSEVGDSTPMALVDAENVAQMSDWK